MPKPIVKTSGLELFSIGLGPFTHKNGPMHFTLGLCFFALSPGFLCIRTGSFYIGPGPIALGLCFFALSPHFFIYKNLAHSLGPKLYLHWAHALHEKMG